MLRDKNVIDELIWSIKIVKTQSSFHGAGEDCAALKLIAPNDLAKFNLDKNTVSSYVNKALGPFFKETIKKDIGDTHPSKI
jgi:hypothetical protein